MHNIRGQVEPNDLEARARQQTRSRRNHLTGTTGLGVGMLWCLFVFGFSTSGRAQTWVANRLPERLGQYIGETGTIVDGLVLVYSTDLPNWNEINARHTESSEVGKWMSNFLRDQEVADRRFAYLSAWQTTERRHLLLAATAVSASQGLYVPARVVLPDHYAQQRFDHWRDALLDWVEAVGDRADLKMTFEISAYTQLTEDRSVLERFLLHRSNFGDCVLERYQDPCMECCNDAKDLNLSRCSRIGAGTTIGGAAAGAAIGGPVGVLLGGMVGAAIAWAVDNLCAELVFQAHGICKTSCLVKPRGPEGHLWPGEVLMGYARPSTTHSFQTAALPDPVAEQSLP